MYPVGQYCNSLKTMMNRALGDMANFGTARAIEQVNKATQAL